MMLSVPELWVAAEEGREKNQDVREGGGTREIGRRVGSDHTQEVPKYAGLGEEMGLMKELCIQSNARF